MAMLRGPPGGAAPRGSRPAEASGALTSYLPGKNPLEHSIILGRAYRDACMHAGWSGWWCCAKCSHCRAAPHRLARQQHLHTARRMAATRRPELELEMSPLVDPGHGHRAPGWKAENTCDTLVGPPRRFVVVYGDIVTAQTSDTISRM